LSIETPLPPSSSMYRSLVPLAFLNIPMPKRTPLRLSVTVEIVSIDCWATG